VVLMAEAAAVVERKNEVLTSASLITCSSAGCGLTLEELYKLVKKKKQTAAEGNHAYQSLCDFLRHNAKTKTFSQQEIQQLWSCVQRVESNPGLSPYQIAELKHHRSMFQAFSKKQRSKVSASTEDKRNKDPQKDGDQWVLFV
jgi:hypothetical protein